MISIDLPDPTKASAATLELRTTRRSGPGIDVPLRLEDRVILGEPEVLRLSADNIVGDDELKSFLVSEKDLTQYWLLWFTCTFEHDEQLPFATTWLELNLTSDHGTAIARSMEPLKLADDSPPLSWHVKLAAPCVIQPEIGVDGQVAREEKIYCEASREGTSRPAWRYFTTRTRTIRGMHRMRLVARTAAGTGIYGSVRMGATVTQAHFGRRLSYDLPPEAQGEWLRASPTHG